MLSKRSFPDAKVSKKLIFGYIFRFIMAMKGTKLSPSIKTGGFRARILLDGQMSQMRPSAFSEFKATFSELSRQF
jgi:hypothetical protein